jgi:hypothetical protein
MLVEALVLESPASRSHRRLNAFIGQLKLGLSGHLLKTSKPGISLDVFVQHYFFSLCAYVLKKIKPPAPHGSSNETLQAPR